MGDQLDIEGQNRVARMFSIGKPSAGILNWYFQEYPEYRVHYVSARSKANKKRRVSSPPKVSSRLKLIPNYAIA